MQTLISVIICTHNPREDYLGRVLGALRAQTLPRNNWELLLIDSASQTPLADHWILDWHENARVFREEQMGVATARLRGIRESRADLLVFVDDDNVLFPDYLERALGVAQTRPYLGAFGASSFGEFEAPPPQSITKYIHALAVSEVKQDYWGNIGLDGKCFPFGAGLCIRKEVCETYFHLSNVDSRRKQLDRTGKSLASHGDTDLVLCALDMGLGTGRFKDLKLTHLIPGRRLTEDYIVELLAGEASSMQLLKAIRNIEEPATQYTFKALLKRLLLLIRSNRFDRRILLATRRAQDEVRRSTRSSKLSDHSHPRAAGF